MISVPFPLTWKLANYTDCVMSV